MANRSRRKTIGKPTPPRGPHQPAKSADARAREKAAEVAQALQRAGDESQVRGALTAEGLATTAHLTSQADDLLSAYDALVNQAAEYERCADAAKAREQAAEQATAAADSDRSKLTQDLERTAAARETTEKLKADATAAVADLDAREQRVRRLEREAEAGFDEKSGKAQAELEQLLAERRRVVQAELDDQLRALDERREADIAELEELRKEKLAEAERRQAELDRGEEQLRFDRGALRGQQIGLERRELDLEAEITARAAHEVATIDRELHVAKIEVEASAETIDDLRQRLAHHERVQLKIGSTDPATLLAELEQLRAANTELRDKLAVRLADDDLDRLRELERVNRFLTAERERTRYELQELRGTALANRINNLQVKQLSDAEQHFDVLRRGYESRIAELRSAVEELYRDRTDPETPLFPRCVAMDDETSLAERGAVATSPVELSVLARSLQATMFGESRLAYRLNDICVLLGGLAMSRLHLLEGMSGIGKTSLPTALAAALGTGHAVIEVQAGWRDRTDLFGHHNTFEQRFEETEFLQALYLAQTPQYQDRPFFIILDEMNLSRPEQYFSVVLSKLENRDKRPIQLVTRSSGRAPRHLVEGTQIMLPDNVWFIGTANQDESTLEFADKTYNRAHLMELPAQRPHLPAASTPEVLPYGTAALRTAFASAQRTHHDDTNAAWEFFHGLSDDLNEHGHTAIGPRLEKQLKAFVPVVISALAGTRPEEGHDYGDSDQDGRSLAVDRFLVTKILRPVRSRYDVTPENLSKLRDAVHTHWELHDLAGSPVRSARLLDEEQRRREG